MPLADLIKLFYVFYLFIYNHKKVHFAAEFVIKKSKLENLVL